MSDDIGRLTRLLPLACLAAAICLFASELMTTFAFTPPGGEVLQVQGGADRHGNALMVIAVFAIGALAVAIFAASKPAALAVAIAGVIALLVFLLVDLPDANAVGTLDDARQSFFDAEAVPQGGFFLEMAGALALAVTGVALATLTPEQLGALRPRARAGRRQREEAAAAPEPGVVGPHDAKEQPDPQHRLAPRRPRARQRG
jgi:hypothetical protein